MDDEILSAYINEFVKRSFRDVADQDYIMARAAFRYELDLQFIWLSQQAIEKYLKAILLFNRRSTKHLLHDLPAAFDAVLAIDDLPFEFPETVRRFVEYIENHASRYFEFPYYVTGEHLLQLDETVWHLRRWCAFVRGKTHVGDGPEDVVDNLPFEIEKRRYALWRQHPERFRLFGGLLEDLVDCRNHRSRTLRPLLIWNNLYFSRRKTASYHIGRSASANSVLSMHPEVFEHLEPLVHFSKDLKAAVKLWGA